MKIIILLFALIVICFSLKSQELNDYIVKRNKDTINCDITDVDENYIYFGCYNFEEAYIYSKISLTKVLSYKKNDKDTVTDTDTENVIVLDDSLAYYNKPNEEFFSFGLGFGLNYGGFGTNFAIAINNLEPFLGLGYNLYKISYNAGLLFRIIPDKWFCPYIGGMFGYNAVIIIKDASSSKPIDEYSNVYFGPSLCAGFELFTKNNNNHFNFTLIKPFRSTEYSDDIDAILKNPNIKGFNVPPDFTISFGFHF